MIDGYTDVAVVVKDAQKSKKWYVDTLGFKVVLDRGHAICVSPNVKEGGLYLHLCGDGFAPLEPGNTGIGFTADDYDNTCDELEAKGVKFTMHQNEDGYKVAKFLDPDGNEFWLFESDLAKKVREECQEITTDRKFASFNAGVSITSGKDDLPEFRMKLIPDGGFCLSTFLVLSRENRPEEVLVGHLNPDAPWDHIGALDQRVVAHGKGWMLTSSHLIVRESPQDAAARILKEQLEVESRDVRLAEPRVVSEVYTPVRFSKPSTALGH